MNAQAHATGSGLAMAIAAWCDAGRGRPTELPDEQRFVTAVTAGSIGAFCGSLPDLIEPAVHPNHRQFFHSVAFALMLVGGMRQMYRWDPDEAWQRVFRGRTDIACYFREGLHFVGYWHTHPEPSPTLSGIDRHALDRNIREGILEIERMIAVVVGNGTGDCTIRAYLTDRGHPIQLDYRSRVTAT